MRRKAGRKYRSKTPRKRNFGKRQSITKKIPPKTDKKNGDEVETLVKEGEGKTIQRNSGDTWNVEWLEDHCWKNIDKVAVKPCQEHGGEKNG